MLLDELFSPEWFSNPRNAEHPAYLRRAQCAKILSQGNLIRIADDPLTEIGHLILDSTVLINAIGGNLNTWSLGPLSLYGNEAVQSRIRSEARSSNKFRDIMVELTLGAWHRNQSHVVTPMEIEGPDFAIDVPGADLPVYAECKHIMSDSPNRLIGEVRNANRQLRTILEPHYGSAYFDISTVIRPQRIIIDHIPEEIIGMKALVESSLRGDKNRSVGAVVLAWDDFRLDVRSPEMPEWIVDKSQVTMIYRRRSLVIRHTSPLYPIPDSVPLFTGFRTGMGLVYEK